MTNEILILLVDDDEDEWILLESLIRKMPGRPASPRFTVRWISDFDGALRLTEQEEFDLHLVDYRLGEHDGLELMREWAQRGVNTPVVLLTGQGNYEVDLAAMQEGAADYLSKDQLTPALLERTIRYALENRHTQEELERRVRERTAELEAEIAARKQMEDVVRVSEARFRALTETTSAAIFIVQAGTIRYANPAARFVTGYTPKELGGMPFKQLTHPAYHDAVERMGRVGRWSESLPARFELKLITRQGDERWVDITAGDIDYDGQPASIITAFDITERDLAEKALQQAKADLQIRVDERTTELREAMELSEERAGILEAIFASMPSAIVVFDARGNPVRVNPASIALYGFYPGEKLREQLLERIGLERPDGEGGISPAELPLRRAMAGEVVTNEPYIYTDPGGRRFNILVSASPILTSTGTEGAILMWHDVTERAQLSAELEIERSRLQVIIQNAPAAILAVDQEGTITVANPQAEQMIGGFRLTGLGTERQLNILKLRRLDGTLYQPEELILVRAAREGRSFSHEEMLLRSEQGADRYILGFATPVVDKRGRTTGAIGIFQDITARKVREQEIEQNAVRAEILSTLTQSFAAAGLELQSVLDTIATRIGERLGDGCIIRLASPDGRWLDPVSLYFSDPEIVETIKNTLPVHRESIGGLIGQVARTGISSRLSSDNPETIKAHMRKERIDLLSRLPIYSHLVVPLRAPKEIIGTISLIRTRPGSPYSERDQEFFEDLAERAALAIENARLHEQVKQLASRDALTGQYNRRAFFEIGHDEMIHYHDSKSPLSAIMLDIDFFKEINDQYGHALGDRVLQLVVDRAREYIRHTDILGRYGGDEYAVLLPNTPLATAAAVAQRIQEAITERPFLTEQGPVQVSVSLGVTQAHADMKDIHALLVQADRALYSAKRNGRNRVEKV